MSTSSYSMTFPCQTDKVEAAAAAIKNYNLDPLDEAISAHENILISTFSRNAELEWRASHAVDGFKCAGLNYLVEAGETMQHLGKWYACGLVGAALLKAIDGLRSLLANFQHDPDTAGGYMEWSALDEDELSLLRNPPASLEEAAARNKYCNEMSGGVDVAVVISFLQGQLALLEFARENAMGVVYCVSNN